jgi:hypothetical protein
MGIDFDSIKNKAQEALGKHGEKIEEGIDKTSDFAKSKFGQHADKIDGVTGKAKDFLHKNQPPDENPPGQQPPA